MVARTDGHCLLILRSRRVRELLQVSGVCLAIKQSRQINNAGLTTFWFFVDEMRILIPKMFERWKNDKQKCWSFFPVRAGEFEWAEIIKYARCVRRYAVSHK